MIVGSVSGTSGVSRCLYSFCPEILFEDDDTGVFALIADLCRLLKLCKSTTADESRCAVVEFGSYVIEKRGQHRSSVQSAAAIGVIIEYLVQDFRFQSRVRLLRVFKLCCLAIKTPDVVYPSVSISLSGCTLREDALQNCIRLVQFYVFSDGFSHQCFFTGQTLDAVRAAVDQSGVFFVSLCAARLIRGKTSLVQRTPNLSQFRGIYVIICSFSGGENTRPTIVNVIRLMDCLALNRVKDQSELAVRLGV